jgi:ABC-type sugar transport system ATPase subunit
MRIILEGPDGSGKSTLLEWLAKKTQREIIHGGGPPENMTELFRRIALVLDNPEGLFDRITMVSEQVYGPILRKVRLLEEENWIKYLQQLAGDLLIYCRPPDSILLGNADKLEIKEHKPAAFVQKIRENLPAIIKAYDKIMIQVKGTGLKVITFDRSTMKFKDLLPILQENGLIPTKEKTNVRPQSDSWQFEEPEGPPVTE